MSNTTYVAFPITHIEFDQNWPAETRNILLQNVMDENDDDNTYEIGQTITILKSRLSFRVIEAYNWKCGILQLEEDILRQINDGLKGSMFSVCFANLKMYMEKLSRWNVHSVNN